MLGDLPVVRWMLAGHRRALLILGSNSLVFGLLGSPVLPRILRGFVYSGELVFPAILTILSVSRGVLGGVGNVAGIAFDLYLIALFIPVAVRRSRLLEPMRTDRVVQLALVVGFLPIIGSSYPLVGVAFGAYLFDQDVPGFVGSNELLHQLLVPTIFVGIIVFPCLVYWRHWRPLPLPKRADRIRRIDREVSFYSNSNAHKYSQFQVRRWFADGGLYVRLVLLIFVAVQGLLIFAFGLVVASALAIMGLLFPFVEIATLVALGLAVIARRYDLDIVSFPVSEWRGLIPETGGLVFTTDGIVLILLLLSSVLPMVLVGMLGIFGLIGVILVLTAPLTAFPDRTIFTGAPVDFDPTDGQIALLFVGSVGLAGFAVYVFWTWKRIIGTVTYERMTDRRSATLPSRVPVIVGWILLVWLSPGGTLLAGRLAPATFDLVRDALLVLLPGAIALGVWRTERGSDRSQSADTAMRVAFLITLLFCGWVTAIGIAEDLNFPPKVLLGIPAFAFGLRWSVSKAGDFDKPLLATVNVVFFLFGGSISILFISNNIVFDTLSPLVVVPWLGVTVIFTALFGLLTYLSVDERYGIDRYPRTPDAASVRDDEDPLEEAV